MLIAILICAILVGIDQIIKLFTIYSLKPIENIDLIKNFFSLTYVENRGAAFGMLEGGRYLFIILTIIVCSYGFYLYYKLNKKNENLLLRTGILLVCSGAIGNIIDRIFRGFVVDMLNFYIFGYDFPVFNFADICVCVGAFLIILSSLLFDKE